MTFISSGEAVTIWGNPLLAIASNTEAALVLEPGLTFQPVVSG